MQVGVLIAGATGVLGRRLVRLLSASGHEVIGLSRNDQGDEIVRGAGGEPSRASLFNPDELTNAAGDGCSAIVHVATAIPKKQRPSAADWQTNDRIRVEGTRALIEVAERVGAEQFIFQSIVWVNRPNDQRAFDEHDPPTPDAVTASAVTAEQMALEAGERLGFTTTVLRGGWFYGPDSWHTRSFGEGLKKRMLPIVGSGEAYWSILHLDDAASAYVVALERQPWGIFNIVDDEPVQVRNFFRYFAERLGAKPPMRVPVWLARLAAGRFAAEFATTSTITSASKFKIATGWEPEFNTYRSGLEQIVRTWEERANADR